MVVGLAGAVDTFASQASGAGNAPLLGVILQRALAINAAACVPPILLWWLAPGTTLLFWEEDPSMAAAALRYARLWSPVLVLHASSQCVYRYLVAQGGLSQQERQPWASSGTFLLPLVLLALAKTKPPA